MVADWPVQYSKGISKSYTTPFPVEEHVSGFQMESTPEADKEIEGYTAEVSGQATLIDPKPETLVKKSEVKTQVSEAEIEVHKTETQTNKNRRT